MAWKSAYTRDLSSKYTSLPTSTTGERSSRWSRNPNTETNSQSRSANASSNEENAPLWAKTSIYHNPSSVVQRLKERYSDTSKTENTIGKRPEVKDLTLNLTTRPYGRTSTSTLNLKESDSKYYNKVEPAKSYGSDVRKDNKEVGNTRPSYTYTRTDTDNTPGSLYTSRATLRKKSPETEKSSLYEYRTRKPDYSPIESKPKIYQSSSLGSSPSTSRYLGAKRFSNSSSSPSTPATPSTPTSDRNNILESFEKAQTNTDPEEDSIVVVTRGTSPTQPSTSVYVRTRRADSARTIEKTIKRPKVRPSTSDAEVQVDDLGTGSAIKHIVSDPTSRLKPWSSYMDKYSSSNNSYNSTSRFSSRTPYSTHTPSRYETSDYRRSISRETPQRDLNSSIRPKNDETPKSPDHLKSAGNFAISGKKVESESQANVESKMKSSLTISVSPRGLSPVEAGSKNSENIRSRSKTQDSDTGNSISDISEDKRSASRETSKYLTQPSKKSEKKSESPITKPIPHLNYSQSSPTKSHRAVNGLMSPPKMGPSVLESSASESSSSEDESTSTDTDLDDDNVDFTKSSQMSSAKKSITNFLQNSISKTDCSSSRSRSKIHRSSAAKIKFKPIESGERAWWLDSTGDVPEGIIKLTSSTSVNQKIGAMNHLEAPSQLGVRQFSRDKDWLKSSNEDVSEKDGGKSEPRQSPLCNPQSKSPTTSQLGENCEISLSVPKLNIMRHFNDEKPWWMNEENSSHDSSRKSPIAANTELKKNLEAITHAVNGFIQEEADEEDIDVTPALRRRWEQHQGSAYNFNGLEDYHIKSNADEEEKNSNQTSDSKQALEECKKECSVKDITMKLVNGLNSILEEKKTIIEEGEMSGMLTKAKEELLRAQTKIDVKANSEEKRIKSKELERAEIDMYWKELIDSLDRPLNLCDLDFTDLTSADENDLNGIINGKNTPPAPPPMGGLPPAPPPSMMQQPGFKSQKAPVPPPPPITKNTKTVKLFWREVRADRNGPDSFLWDELQPVILDTTKLEHLFESRAKDLTKKQQEQNKTKAVIVLDHKRSNAINIGMTKLPPPRAIKTAILKMDSSVVNKEGIEKLLTMLPTEEEILRIQEAQSAAPELPLGTAEQFLLTLATISELEARLKLWAFKMDFENSEKEICEPLYDLKQGMDLLRNNRTFHRILSTLLSIGNFLNGNSAKGFQIDYLAKVPEVKDTVNKHSLLHHLCVIVMEKFPDSTDLYSEIGPVTRASRTDFDELAINIKKVEDECKCSWNHLKVIAQHEGQTQMKMKMSDFLADCAERIIVIGVVHRRVLCRFRKFLLWLGIPFTRIQSTTPHEIMKIIAEFALEYRTTRERILQQAKKTSHRDKSRSRIFGNGTVKKMNSKEAKEDAKLRQLLNGDEPSLMANRTATWRRQKAETSDKKSEDNEILETLIKTANQAPNSAIKERRKSRIIGK